ncbi:hypothetical protein [Streptomyces sp. NBC_01185]|uniref:hypothetical protein n=1 Tax=Streptomyces sp. NBC_01185 TaxID=2903764 RepID=UPI00386E3B9B|nr:SDR family oxidoreductase [Streptomyces sp. NBC_01185]
MSGPVHRRAYVPRRVARTSADPGGGPHRGERGEEPGEPGRTGTVDEVAPLVVFLLSDESPWLEGRGGGPGVPRTEVAGGRRLTASPAWA